MLSRVSCQFIENRTVLMANRVMTLTITSGMA